MVFSTRREASRVTVFARATMSDAPSAPLRDGVTVTPPRTTRIPPLNPETPESQAPNPHQASNNPGLGQQPQRTGGFGASATSSEAMPPKLEDEEDAEQQDALVDDVNRTHVSSDTPAADVAAVARLARDDDRTWADADEQRDEPAEDEPMAESGDEREAGDGLEADLPDEAAHDESTEDTDADERDDMNDTEDEDMAAARPERWSFLDLRGGHHALDVYHEVRLVVFLDSPFFATPDALFGHWFPREKLTEKTHPPPRDSRRVQSGGLDGSSYGDTTAAQASRGRDIQGIPWDRLQFTRERYREKRVSEYKNYANLDIDVGRLDAVCTPVAEVGEDDARGFGAGFDECFGVDEGFDAGGHGLGRVRERAADARRSNGKYYHFAHNTRAVRSNFVHFQLRNLVWATSKNDAYVMSENRIVHWNAATRRATTTLDLDGGGGGDPPPETPPRARGDDDGRDADADADADSEEEDMDGESLRGRFGSRGTRAREADGGVASFALAGNFPRIQVSTTCARDSLVAAGGFAGELVVLDVDTGVGASARVTTDDNGITNAVDFFSTPSGAEALVCSNNDKATRWYDIATMRCVARHEYPWAVNYTAVGRDGTLAAVVGDAKEAWVVDTRTGKLAQTCEGHLDFSFAAAWHPDGVRFATGNQDTTARVWDIRHTGQSLAVLRGRMGAVRSLRFSSDGAFLAAAEPADFVHVYDVNASFTKKQTLDHFGETAGVSFSPCGEALFVGVADLTYGSVLEFERSRWGHGAAAVA